MSKEKIKGVYKEYFNDRKTIMTIFCLSIVFILVILMSFGINFVFNPSIDNKWWSDLAITFSLCVYCLYFGIPEARELYKKKKDGRYQRTKFAFIEARGKVSEKDEAFSQWLEVYYQKNKLDYFYSLLSLHGNINKQVLDLDYNELDNLLHPYKKNWDNTEFKGREDTYFRTLTQEQVDMIKAIFKGKVVVEKIPDDFFKTLDGSVISSEYVEQSRRTRKETRQYTMLIIYRVLAVFVFALVFSIFGMQMSSEELTAAVILQRVISTLSRLWTMISSFTYGFAVGKIMTMNEARKLEYKTRVNTEFFNDKDFKPLSLEEVAKKEYEDYEKKVIVPEVLDNLDIENNTKLIDNNNRLEYGKTSS